MHLRLLYLYSVKGRQLLNVTQEMREFNIKIIKIHNTSMAYVKKLSQFLYCDLYGTTLTCKHKDMHSFTQLTVVSMQLIVLS
jgi:hypothetical protein